MSQCAGCPCVDLPFACPAVARPAPGLCDPARRPRYAGVLRQACLTERHPPGTDRTAPRAAAAAPAPPRPTLAAAPYDSADQFLPPLRRNAAGGPELPAGTRTWEGCAPKKPWEYRVTAALVHLDCPEILADVLATLRAQTERPYLLVVDTGSTEANLARLRGLALAGDDLEVIAHWPRGWRMSSQPCAVAMDFAFAACQTPYLYATHTDVFLKRPDFLEYLLQRCDARTPAVGYQMSSRVHMREPGVWENTLSHTATMYHLPTMRAIKARWSMIATYERFGLEPKQPTPGDPIFPDTEVEIGYCFRESGIGVRWPDDPPPGPDDPPSVLMIGTEPNEPYENEWLEHIRSYTSYEFYNATGAGSRRAAMARARTASRARVAAWRAGAPSQAATVTTMRRLAKARTCPDRTEEGEHG